MLPTHRPPTHPGEMLLKEFLEPLGVSQAEAAIRMSIPFQRLKRLDVQSDHVILERALTLARSKIFCAQIPRAVRRSSG